VGANTSKAGLQRLIAENPHKEIIIIDEIDKMPLKDQEGLLSMMERGEFTSTKVRNTKTVALLVLPILVVLKPIKITITTNTTKAF
jgi:DNA-binding NtrC family response regulator